MNDHTSEPEEKESGANSSPAREDTHGNDNNTNSNDGNLEDSPALGRTGSCDDDGDKNMNDRTSEPEEEEKESGANSSPVREDGHGNDNNTNSNDGGDDDDDDVEDDQNEEHDEVEVHQVSPSPGEENLLTDEMMNHIELVRNSEPSTPLEKAFAAVLYKKDLEIMRLRSEMNKLNNFISKRKQTYKRKRKEQGAPTRALSAYNIFVQDKFSRLAKENQKALKSSDADIQLKRVPPASTVASTGQAWRALPPEERKKYDDLAKADKERYHRQMAEYNPPDKFKNKKRSKTAYNVFFSAHVCRLKQTNEGVPSDRGGVAKVVGEAWKDLSTDERHYYEREAEKQNAADPPDTDTGDEIEEGGKEASSPSQPSNNRTSASQQTETQGATPGKPQAQRQQPQPQAQSQQQHVAPAPNMHHAPPPHAAPPVPVQHLMHAPPVPMQHIPGQAMVPVYHPIPAHPHPAYAAHPVAHIPVAQQVYPHPHHHRVQPPPPYPAPHPHGAYHQGPAPGM